MLYKCDLCDEIKECLPKVIDGKEYDICRDCWESLEQKLKGKGRPKGREAVYIPAREGEPEKQKPSPSGPPTIWCELRPGSLQVK